MVEMPMFNIEDREVHSQAEERGKVESDKDV